MKTQNKGFTLIEVMVAVGVIAIALPALLFAMMAEIDGAAYMRDKLQAQWVAENVLEEVRIQNRINGSVPEAEKSGEEELGERKWFWKSRSKAFPQKELSDIFGVEVSVWLLENKTEEPMVKLVGIVRQHRKEAVIRPAGEGMPAPGPAPEPNPAPEAAP